MASEWPDIGADQTGPGVRLPPPVVFLAGLGLGFLLQRAFPLAFAAPGNPLPRWLGGPLRPGLRGLGPLGASALSTAPAPPSGPTAAPRRSSTRGPFRFTRNPLYLSLSLLQAGLALLANALWPATHAAASPPRHPLLRHRPGGAVPARPLRQRITRPTGRRSGAGSDGRPGPGLCLRHDRFVPRPHSHAVRRRAAALPGPSPGLQDRGGGSGPGGAAAARPRDPRRTTWRGSPTRSTTRDAAQQAELEPGPGSLFGATPDTRLARHPPHHGQPPGGGPRRRDPHLPHRHAPGGQPAGLRTRGHQKVPAGTGGLRGEGERAGHGVPALV